VCPKKAKQIGISIDAATEEYSTVELCGNLGIGESIVKALLKIWAEVLVLGKTKGRLKELNEEGIIQIVLKILILRRVWLKSYV